MNLPPCSKCGGLLVKVWADQNIQPNHFKCINCGRQIHSKDEPKSVCAEPEKKKRKQHKKPEPRVQRYCADCGKPVSVNATRCKSCATRVNNAKRLDTIFKNKVGHA